MVKRRNIEEYVSKTKLEQARVGADGRARQLCLYGMCRYQIYYTAEEGLFASRMAQKRTQSEKNRREITLMMMQRIISHFVKNSSFSVVDGRYCDGL